jgi:hypothetical protein
MSFISSHLRALIATPDQIEVASALTSRKLWRQL